MNYRDYKQFAKGTVHHVYNRGVGKMDIFKDEQDLGIYISLLRDNLFPKAELHGSLHGDHPDGHHGGTEALLIAERHTPYIRKTLPAGSFSLFCYCLMPNHFHLVVKQLGDVSIGEFIARVSTAYSKYFNKKYERVGSVYQDTFKAVLIENDSYLMWLTAYVHQNPKTAGLVKDLKDYKWSSYLDYIGLRQGTLCDKSFVLSLFRNDLKMYEAFVKDSFEKIKERKELDSLLID